MKFEKLKPGMTVYDVGRVKMGNTTLSTVSVWDVRILEVDADLRRVVASWNGNKPRQFSARDAEKWREKKPTLICGMMGSRRLATREEKKALSVAMEGR